MVILKGEIKKNEIFKRIVDSGNKIESVVKLLNSLKDYFSQMPKYKIGNILSLKENHSKIEFKVEYQQLTNKK